MRHTVKASALARETALEGGFDPEIVVRLLAEAGDDFPITLDDRLPFGINRLGMLGITLGRHVHLLHSSRRRDPYSLLLLIRHEAEHVRQQREMPITFYVRYVASWLWGFLGPDRGRLRPPVTAPRWVRAYHAIGAEKEARRAEAHFGARLTALSAEDLE